MAGRPGDGRDRAPVKRSYSPNYGKRRRPHTGPEVYLVGLERRDGMLHGLFWGPWHPEFAMPLGDEQPRGRVRVEMLKVGVFGQMPIPAAQARQDALEAVSA